MYHVITIAKALLAGLGVTLWMLALFLLTGCGRGVDGGMP